MKLLSSLVLAMSTSLISFLFPDTEQTMTVIEDANQEVEDIQIDQEDKYDIYWFQASPTSTVDLHYNLNEPSTAQEAYQLHECDYLVNGGFYAKDNSPIGWFVNHQGLLSEAEKNILFNGFVSLSDNMNIDITKNPPVIGSLQFGLQTGPLLIYQEQPIKLILNQDKYARRSFLIETQTDSVLFGMVTSRDSHASGPLLSEMPDILNEFALRNNIHILNAINLDGGSASAFITPEIEILELKPIGSYFCIKHES